MRKLLGWVRKRLVKPPVVIVMTKRTHDFHACIKGHPEHWACGKSPDAAVGALAWNHGSYLGVHVVFNPRPDAYPDGCIQERAEDDSPQPTSHDSL